MEKSNEIRIRSYNFALRIIKLCKYLENDKSAKAIHSQLLTSGTSIGANVEEAIGAQSRKDFISKMTIALKEARETFYWLKLLKDSEIISENMLSNILDESEQLIKIISEIVITSRKTTNI